MTKREKVIVSAYTSVLMCDMEDLSKYIEQILGRKVYTRELADKQVVDEIKTKSKQDFLRLCSE